jgi:hypothetical protein
MHIVKRHPFPAVVVSFCLLTAVWSGSLHAREAEENYRWDEAVKFVDSLPFSERVIDSLKKTYRVSFPATPLRVIPEKDFFKAETLVYDIGWGPFKAGYVVLTAAADTASHTIKLGGKGLSNGFVTTFYRMRDYVISTIDAKGLYPLFFEQHLREGKHYRSDGWILFDHLKKNIYVKERRLKTLEAPVFINDFLSVLFLVRTKQIAPGDKFSLPLYADGKVHFIDIACKGRETLNLDGAKTPTLLVVPKLVGDKGAFNKKGRLEIWLSDDEAKIPVQIKSKISIGAITAKLLYCSNPRLLVAAAPKTDDTVKRNDADIVRLPGSPGAREVRETDSTGAGDAAGDNAAMKKTGAAAVKDTTTDRDTLKHRDSTATSLH